MRRRPQSIKLFCILIYWGRRGETGIEFATIRDMKRTAFGILLLSFVASICKAEYWAVLASFKDSPFPINLVLAISLFGYLVIYNHKHVH